jgi:hypothetical protein
MHRLAALLLALPCLASAQMFAEAGMSGAQTQDGLWYQQAFDPHVDARSGTFAVGYRVGAWSVGGAYLLRTSSVSQATVLDADYDPGAGSCLRNCDAPATFETRGAVYGAFVRREWVMARGVTFELGALAFVPRQTVWVSGWRAGGDPAQPAQSARYDNRHEWRLSASLGSGWTDGRWRVMARWYPWIKTGGDEVVGGTFEGLTGLYNGNVATLTVGFDF